MSFRMASIFRFLIVFIKLFNIVHSVPIDNSLRVKPAVECGPTFVYIYAETKNPFNGRIYVKGLSDNPGCRTDGTGETRNTDIQLDFEDCGVSKVRSLNPKGVFVSVTIVISFHPFFVTKVDRAIRIECLYMEVDKTVTNGFQVSMIPIETHNLNVEMPVCKYEVLNGGPRGAPVRYATVGQTVYHKWTCETIHREVFCMFVHSCFVDDSQGDRVGLILPNGCSIDIHLLQEPEYLSDLMAGVETHVFKYSDRPQLYFQCQISILVKQADQSCPRQPCGAIPTANPRPPPLPFAYPLTERDAGLRDAARGVSRDGSAEQREKREFSSIQQADLDVRTEMWSFDLDPEFDESENIDENRIRQVEETSSANPSKSGTGDALCFSVELVFFTGGLIMVLVLALTFVLMFCNRKCPTFADSEVFGC